MTGRAGAARARWPRSTARRHLAGLLLLPWLAACATLGPAPAVPLPPEGPSRVELDATPFFPQDDYQCGPAALATVLAADGVDVTPGELVGEVYLPARQGSLQVELLAAARRRGRLAYVLPADPAPLLQEVLAGRPVLVLQNLGVEAWPFWHYAVLVGADAARGHAILRSGRRPRQVMSWSRFEDSWRRGGRWAVTVLTPGTMPSGAEPARYLEAVAGLEAAGRVDDAAVALAAALPHWPREPLVHLAVGNNAHARHDLPAAVAAYRDGLGLAPDHVVLRNNLAQALLDAGCAAAAAAEARHADQLARGSVVEQAVRATLEAAVAAERRGTVAPGCSLPADGNATGQPLSSPDAARGLGTD